MSHRKKRNQIFRIVEILNNDDEVFTVIINGRWWETYTEYGFDNGYDEYGIPDYQLDEELVRETLIREIYMVNVRSYELRVIVPEFGMCEWVEYEIAKFILLEQESNLPITMERLEPQKLSS